MSNLQMIERLFAMLTEALDVIRQQHELLSMHGIYTEDGGIERKRDQLLSDVEKEGWG